MRFASHLRKARPNDRSSASPKSPLKSGSMLRVTAIFSADLLLGAGVLPRLSVEAHRELALLERVLAIDLHPPFLCLDHVVAGAGVAPEAEGRGGPSVHDQHVLQPPGVRHVLVPREHEIHPRLHKPLQDVTGVEDDVALATGSRKWDEMMVDDEYLELVPGIGEGLFDVPVVLPAHLPIVEVRL